MRIRQFSERLKTCVELGGGAVIAAAVALAFWGGGFQRLELMTYDLRFQVRGERPPLPDILIVAIDEQSEAQLQQRLPWKRSLHARLIRALMAYQPKLIVYDVIFQQATEAAEDDALASAIYDAYDETQQMGKVVLAQYISPERLERPLSAFAENAGGTGMINLLLDSDGIARSVPLVAQTLEGTQTRYHLSLAFEAAALYKGGVNKIDFPARDTTILSNTDGGQTAEVLRVAAPDGKLLINFIGGRYVYPMIPFWKIITGDVRPEEIRDKVIFIGDTTLTSHDYFLTPFRAPARRFVEQLQQETAAGATLTNTSTFGIEIHAQAFQTILEQTELRKIPPEWMLLVIVGVGTLSGLLLFHEWTFWGNSAIMLLCAAALFGVGQYLFSAQYLWLDLAPLEAAIGLNYIVGLGFQRWIALYNRNKIKGAFEQYVSTAVVEEMLRHPEKLHLGGERKFLTVLFSDIRGFTSISEGMESQNLVVFLNAYLTEMTEIILNYHGTLDKYMGDAIMAIYGAPVEQPDHQVRACASALDMMVRLRELQTIWEREGKPIINIGIGINSGAMTVGNMGSEKRFDYTVMGDNVNLGSRLEGLNKEYGTNIIISEFTHEHVHGEFLTRELDAVRVKGKHEPVRIYELLGRPGEVRQEKAQAARHFELGLSAYRTQAWHDAIEQFSEALRCCPEDVPSQLYLRRCEAYQQTPPPEHWDGVYTMTHK